MATRVQFKEICRAGWRVATERVSLFAILTILVGLAGGGLLQKLFLGQITKVSAWHSFVTNLGAMLDHPVVRLALLGYGLFLLGRSAIRVSVADDVRAAEHVALREKGAQFAASANEQLMGELRGLLDDGREFPQKLAYHHILAEKVTRSAPLVKAAENAIGAYRQAIVNARGSDYQSLQVKHMLSGSLSDVLATVANASFALGIELDFRPPPLHPDFQLMTNTERFDAQKHHVFLNDHEQNLRAIDARLAKIKEVQLRDERARQSSEVAIRTLAERTNG